MNKLSISMLFLLLCGTLGAQEPLLDTMKKELDHNFTVLKEQPIPAYYVSLRIDQTDRVRFVANLGYLSEPGIKASTSNRLSAAMRVGNHTLDNTHEVRESGSSPGYIFGYNITADNNEKDLRNTIWTHLDRLYRQESQDYEKIKANIAVKVEQEDKSPDFSIEEAENYYEQPIVWDDLHINIDEWNEKVKRYSAVFGQNPDLREGIAMFEPHLIRTYMVDTEGRTIAQNAVYFVLMLSAETMADDGMILPLYKSWWVHSIDELPSDEEVMAAVENISKTLSDLRVAPVAESYTGPALLAPEAAGVFFHEIFGHRIEGARLKSDTDAHTFKKKIGERVLPKHFSITFDPQVKYYNGRPLAGHYVMDDEGIRGEKVEIIKNGVLKNFLMSRTPIEGFAKSNGHGRLQVGASYAVTRQSNMFIESSQKNTQADLVKMLRKEAKKQGKEYAYLFHDVSGGYTMTSRYSPNAFNVSPLVVYRIYVDGRPDELVRGVDLVGTPLAMFSQIDAAGTDYGIFNGWCGAESGSVPVSAVAPTLLVKQVETQKKAKSQSMAPIMDKPQVDKTNQPTEGSEIILQAIRKEVDRAMTGLKTDDLQPPFFIANGVRDGRLMSIATSNGGIVSAINLPFRNYEARMLIGDYQTTDEHFRVQSSYNYDYTPTCIENDEMGIRFNLWRSLDSQYKRAAETYELKMAALKQLDIPAKELELPDWEKVEPVKLKLPSQKLSTNTKDYEAYMIELSRILAASTKNLYSNVNLTILQSDYYLYNTEGSEVTVPYNFAVLRIQIAQKDEKGENYTYTWNYHYNDTKELPDMAAFSQEAQRLAGLLNSFITAEKLDEAYTGPVLFIDDAVSNAFTNNFFGGGFSLVAARKELNTSGHAMGGNKLEEMIGKRVTSTEITVEDLTGTPEYNGKPLFGYAAIDAQGVKPQPRTVLIENGILQTLLNDRVPTEKIRNSTGHALLGPQGGSRKASGVARMSLTTLKSKEELMEELFKGAEEAGYDYAYLVKNIGGNSPELYRVYRDGREERFRDAMINNFSNESFKKILAASTAEKLYNNLPGHKMTVIVPEAILFEELQIQDNGMNNFNRPPLVPRPLISGE